MLLQCGRVGIYQRFRAVFQWLQRRRSPLAVLLILSSRQLLVASHWKNCSSARKNALRGRCGSANLQKIIRFQRSAANKPPVDARFAEQGARIVGFLASAIEHGHMCKLCIQCGERAMQYGMVRAHFICLRAFARANRPDRFVGNHKLRGLFSRQDIQHPLELSFDRPFGAPGVALGARFSDTDHGRSSRVQRAQRLLCNDLIAFLMMGAPFGMADQCECCAEFSGHCRRHFAGIRALRMRGDILYPPRNAAAVQQRLSLGEIGKGTHTAICSAFFSGLPGVASRSPYELAAGSPPSLRDGDLIRPHRSPYCLRARSLGNLTEKCSSVPLSCSAPWVNALSNAALRARLPCIFQLPMMSLRVESGIRGPNPATHPADLSAYVQGIPDIRS